MKRLLALTLIATCILLGLSCTSTSKATPPDYIKDVVSYQEGTDAIVVYFVLADSNGAETSASGSVRLRIVQEETSYLTDKTWTTTLYDKTFNVTASDFHKTTVGQGAFARERIICSFGRITYAQFYSYPSGDFPSGKVTVDFTTESGRVLTGSDTILY